MVCTLQNLLALYSILSINIVDYVYYIYICVILISKYALKAPREMSFGSSGLPFEDKDVFKYHN